MVAAMNEGRTPGRADFHEAIAGRAERWFAACMRITRSRDLAEDAVQDALLSAWDKRDQFRQDARLDTWIHRIAVNSALQLMRRQRPGVFEPLIGETPDESMSPEAARKNQDLGRCISAALDCLSDTERVCFVLKHLEQWRLKEIADELDVGINTVKQALFRAVRKLRADDTDLEGELR